MKQTWLRLKIFWKAIGLARNPERTNLVFDIGDTLYAIGAFEEALNRIRSETNGASVLANRKLLGAVELDQLIRLPAGTLGHEFASHMKRLNLDPNFYRTRPVSDDPSFIMMRMRQTHDLWHVVTGFKTDVAGEIALQACMMAYLAIPLTPLLVGSALLKSVLGRDIRIREVVEAVTQGILSGHQTKNLFGYDWEAGWQKPLSEVRSELNLPA